MNQSNYDLMMKMVFVGDSGVGKTNLITRIASDEFHQQHLATIGIDGLKVRVQMWDTAGQERYKSLSAPYYRGAGAVVLCYSLNDEDSLRNLQNWIQQIEKYASPKTQMVLIGCKSDLQHKIPPDVVNQMIVDKGFKHYTTSAKTGEGIHESLKSVITDWTRNEVKESLSAARNGRQNQAQSNNKNKKIDSEGVLKSFKAKTSCC